MKFVGVDGEGLTRDDGQHDYVLLAASDGTCIENWSNNGLATERCFDYLIELKNRNPHSHLIAFSFGYDSNMMFRDIDYATLLRLHSDAKTDWIARKGKKYYVEYIPNKWLAISRSKWDGVKWGRDGSAKIWDVFGFYQQSFVRAIQDWKAATQETIDRIAEMKAQRGIFTEAQIEEIKAYCWEECAILAQLGELLDEALDSAEIEIKQYHGAGAIANALMASHKALDAIVRRPDLEPLWDAILRAYFGGRIETFYTGYIDQTIYEYDVNSAYPSAIRNLPDMKHGEWEHVTEYNATCSYALWRVCWNLEETERVAPFPFRWHTSIFYVRQGEGWYHAPEVQAAIETGFPLRILEGYILHTTSAKPFAWIEDIYTERLRAKQAGDKREKVLKLGMNSLYGKFAQGMSGKDRPGKYQSYYHAGYITSYCRAMMLRAAMQKPDDIVAIATDGIFSLSPLDLELKPGLGYWTEDKPIEDGLMVIQPGLVVSKYESFVRTRGVDRSSIGFDVFMQAWEEMGMLAKVTTVDTRFITLGRALASAKNSYELRKLWRRWIKWPVELGYIPSRKSIPYSAWGKKGGYIALNLMEGWAGEMSGRYELKIEERFIEAEPIDFVDSISVS